MKKFTSRRIPGQFQVPTLALWLIKKGFVKNGTGAKALFYGVVTFNILASIAIVIISYKILSI